ncbi:MAG TPA: FG-GAP-like repeat-containing protein [Mycolicibacterium fallax]|nr:FG-GAP-like repeat-containing protein [Mycolicibacterium fallax]HSA39617.1 FG-GAP-like repeat-containing protein [Mycobacterium sp.]
MQYCLGPGDGTASIFDAPFDLDADGDGVLDAVGLDLDGDGLRDDALADLDGDGHADHAVLDVGSPAPHWFTDDGAGTWALAADPVIRGEPLRWFGLDGAEHTGTVVDFDGDGVAADALYDDNGDGIADRVMCAGADPAGGYRAAFVDTDGDGGWDVRLVDADGDGSADSAAELD